MMRGCPNSWGWLLMVLGMLGFWGLLIALVVVLVRHPGAADPRPHLSPEDLLAERSPAVSSTRTSTATAWRCCGSREPTMRPTKPTGCGR